MWVSLKKPYKIVANKEKRYNEHYQIPASRCLIVPHLRREEEVLCNVHWKEDDGLHAIYDIMFDSESLELINSTEHADLFELWVIFRPVSQKAENSDPLKKVERSITPARTWK